MAKKAVRRTGIRFAVAVEFLAGLVGMYGVGRLFARRWKEGRLLLIISLLLIVPIDLVPRMIGDEYALWAPWLVKGVLAVISAAQFNWSLDRAAALVKRKQAASRRRVTPGNPGLVAGRPGQAPVQRTETAAEPRQGSHG